MKKPVRKSFGVLVLSILFIGLACALSARAETVTVSLSLNNPDAKNLEMMQKQLEDKDATAVVFEFSDSFAGEALFSTSTTPTSYKKNYPNGDAYYLIGDLSNRWSKEDFGKFYDTAKMLATRGFRTIVNVNTYISDVREAVQNSNTSVLIWNSHGSDDGAVYDKKDDILPKDIFTKNKSSHLRYVLFANCYGYTSIDYYQIGGKTLGVGWQEETSSDYFFSYLKSQDFLKDLKKAFGFTPHK